MGNYGSGKNYVTDKTTLTLRWTPAALKGNITQNYLKEMAISFDKLLSW